MRYFSKPPEKTQPSYRSLALRTSYFFLPTLQSGLKSRARGRNIPLYRFRPLRCDLPPSYGRLSHAYPGLKNTSSRWILIERAFGREKYQYAHDFDKTQKTLFAHEGAFQQDLAKPVLRDLDKRGSDRSAGGAIYTGVCCPAEHTILARIARSAGKTY